MERARPKKDRILPYLREFEESRTQVTKSRLRLFCALTLLLFIGTSVFYIILNPQEFKSSELIVWSFLIAASAASLIMNQKVKSLGPAKLNAFLFSMALLASLTALYYMYPIYIAMSSGIFALSMFAISFIVPWDPVEIAAISVSHIICYTALYLHVRFAAQDYTDGVISLLVAFILCAVIKKRDDEMEKENFVLLKEIEKKNAQMEKELALARDIHKTLIPKSMSTDKADIAVSYVPVSTVGGDYATFHVTKDGGLFFLIGDVTGHGVPAALLVNRIYGEIETLLARDCTPGILLKELDGFVQQHFKNTEMYLSVCSGLLDFKRGTLFYSNYGHPPQILHQRQGNRIQLLESQTYLLGIGMGQDEASSKVFEGSLNFEPKDRVILFTDGLIETKGEADELYEMDRLESFVKTHTAERPALFNANLLEEVDGFRRGPVNDDIFLLTIDIK